MLNRRAFLKTSGLALFSASLGGTPLFLGRAARAATNDSGYRRRKTLVAIFQRGAMDGLMAVPPVSDLSLKKLRPRLYMEASRVAADNAAIDLNGQFGLHPAFTPLLPFFREKRLAIVHGCGSPNSTRSHFDAQDYMESGTPGRKGTTSGWMNRAIGVMGHEVVTPFQAVAFSPALPRSLYGEHPALAVTDLKDFRVKVPGQGNLSQTAGKSFESLYQQTTQELLRGSGSDSFDAIDMLSDLAIDSYRPENGADYPNTPLGNSLRQIAMLIKNDLGLEIAFAESNGWDTHVQQGTNQGSFALRARDLARSINAFWTDLGSFQDNTVLMTMTEFGRTVRENGSGGTDHGRGSCMFVLGNQLDGGKVFGNIPEILSPDALADGRDLPVSTDFRSVFAAVAGSHLSISQQNDGILFPDWKGERLPLMKE